MAGTQRKLLALDTNVLFDLAGEKDFAHDFRESFLEKGYALFIPPTAVQELAHFASRGSEAQSKLATKALTSILSWGIKPYNLVGTGHGICEEFYRRLVAKRILPEEEKHDGFILAETAIVEIPVLVTCDQHLLGMNAETLKATFEEADLHPVNPSHPKDLLRAVRKIG